MRELDVLLGQWLERAWPEAPAELRAAFERLLAQEDDAIWDWMMGRVEPPQNLQDIVGAIRAQPITR
jgi:succinate dehydrogenase flavin-adding protein (antitoxin of CptAB toxin-antitoxin module)